MATFSCSVSREIAGEMGLVCGNATSSAVYGVLVLIQAYDATIIIV